jgi:peptide/nickel transport system substrate-binding protein
MFVKNTISVFLLAAACMLQWSCANNKKEHHHIFRYNEQTGIASLDPAFAKNQSIMWAVHQLYNTLVEVDSNLNIVPSLAKSWEFSEGRKKIVFHLRNDVFFHDDAAFPGSRGRKLIAADIVYSFKRIQDKNIASPGAWIFNNKVDTVDAFTALDDSTFQLKLLKPYNPALGILSMQYCSIVPKEAVEKYGTGFRRHAVGTGPFRFVAWEEGQALILKKNPRYFEKDKEGNSLPYLDGIKISFYNSKATEFLLFRQKQLSFINDIDASFKDEVLTKRGTLRESWTGKLVLQTNPYLNTEYFGLLVDSTSDLVRNSPIRLKKIRQAINYGFDRKKMVLYLRNSIGTAAESGFVPAGLPSFDSSAVKGYCYNPEKSRELLNEAGFPNGNGLAEIKLVTIPIYADIAVYISKQLKELGIKVQVEVVPKARLLQMTSSSQALFFRGSWIADYPDTENYLSVFYSKNPAPPNYTRYKNPQFDLLFEKALREENDSIRMKLYQQADQLMIDDAPVVPLWYDKVIRLVQPGVKGFYPNSLNLLELRTCSIK